MRKFSRWMPPTPPSPPLTLMGKLFLAGLLIGVVALVIAAWYGCLVVLLVAMMFPSFWSNPSNQVAAEAPARTSALLPARSIVAPNLLIHG